MLTLWSGSITPSHHRSGPRERPHYHCGACRGRTREWFGGPVHSLGSRTNCGILGVSLWNDFCPHLNPTPLIRLFVFSESPTVSGSGNVPDPFRQWAVTIRFCLPEHDRDFLVLRWRTACHFSPPGSNATESNPAKSEQPFHRCVPATLSLGCSFPRRCLPVSPREN